jgi:hypothetical protein
MRPTAPSTRGFRASFPKGKSWGWWLFRVAPVIGVVFCFPPLRGSGDWRDEATGQPIPGSVALEFDRFLFGYIPSYGWIGSLGREEVYEPGYRAEKDWDLLVVVENCLVAARTGSLSRNKSGASGESLFRKTRTLVHGPQPARSFGVPFRNLSF